MNKQHTALMAAEDGVVVVNDTTAYTAKRFNAFYVSEDTVIGNLEVNGVVADVTANYITTPATGIKAGVLVTSFGDDVFSAITLTSGSVALIVA